MAKTKAKRKQARSRQTAALAVCLVILAVLATVAFILGSEEPSRKNLKETQTTTFGLDVARYQGTVDWAAVAESGVDFAMVRLGYRSLADGVITEDPNARYNLQEASKQGIRLGAYFFSTAITAQEAKEEAQWVADILSQYPITYPVAYNCEGFRDPENRHSHLSVAERTDIALVFLKAIEKQGYEAMFYASKNEMEGDLLWEVSRIQEKYKIWVAQYPELPYPETERSSYEGTHQMWQYTREGTLPGITTAVDLDIAYFGYEGTALPQNTEPPEPALPDPEAMMTFQEVWEHVTAKEEVNLRDIPSQDHMATVLRTLANGEVAMRTGVSSAGWSRLVYEGVTYYAVSSYLTTDLEGTGEDEGSAADPDGDGIDTRFNAADDTVTAKEEVNLRSIPSVTDEEAQILGKLKNGDTAHRIGISDNGWSKLEWNDQICYAVSSYLEVIGAAPEEEGIQTEFQEVDDAVTAKEAVNLRTVPSVTDPESKVVTQIKHGDVVRRTGINTDVGWSRVVWEGQILYCVTSYLETVEGQ